MIICVKSYERLYKFGHALQYIIPIGNTMLAENFIKKFLIKTVFRGYKKRFLKILDYIFKKQHNLSYLNYYKNNWLDKIRMNEEIYSNNFIKKYSKSDYFYKKYYYKNIVNNFYLKRMKIIYKSLNKKIYRRNKKLIKKFRYRLKGILRENFKRKNENEKKWFITRKRPFINALNSFFFKKVQFKIMPLLFLKNLNLIFFSLDYLSDVFYKKAINNFNNRIVANKKLLDNENLLFKICKFKFLFKYIQNFKKKKGLIKIINKLKKKKG